jgi:hypothetical protein
VLTCSEKPNVTHTLSFEGLLSCITPKRDAGLGVHKEGKREAETRQWRGKRGGRRDGRELSRLGTSQIENFDRTGLVKIIPPAMVKKMVMLVPPYPCVPPKFRFLS